METKDVYNELNEAEIKILNLIDSNAKYKTKDLVELTHFSERYINKIIRSLKDKKYIERIGAKKNGYWKVLK